MTNQRWKKWFSLAHPAGMYRWMIRPVVDVCRDLVLGVNTALPVRHHNLEFDAEQGVHYSPSNWSALQKILPREEAMPTDVFLDVGCGKGAVLCQAMTYPFSRVVGVELSPSLCAVARRNAARFSKRHAAAQFEVVAADAREYKVPLDVTVVYMFNPFVDEVFVRFVERILASIEENPRKLRLIYNNPVMHSVLVEHGFELIRSEHFLARPPSVIQLYTIG